MAQPNKIKMGKYANEEKTIEGFKEVKSDIKLLSKYISEIIDISNENLEKIDFINEILKKIVTKKDLKKKIDTLSGDTITIEDVFKRLEE